MKNAPNFDYLAHQLDCSDWSRDPDYPDGALGIVHLNRNLSGGPHIRFSRTDFNEKAPAKFQKALFWLIRC